MIIDVDVVDVDFVVVVAFDDVVVDVNYVDDAVDDIKLPLGILNIFYKLCELSSLDRFWNEELNSGLIFNLWPNFNGTGVQAQQQQLHWREDPEFKSQPLAI